MEIVKKTGLNNVLNPLTVKCKMEHITKPNCTSCDHTVYTWILDWSSYLNQKVLLWGLLSPLEQKKARHFLHQCDQDKYTVIRGLLRILMGSLLNLSPRELVFEYTEFGKPKLMNEIFEFNLSHSKSHVIYAFCKDTPLGVDIEYLNPEKSIDQLAKRYFSKRENNILATLKGHRKKEAFYQGWVQKEAIVKALGIGFQMPLANIEVSLDTFEVRCLNAPLLALYHPQQLLLYPIEKKGFKSVLALCSDKESIELKSFEKIDSFQ